MKTGTAVAKERVPNGGIGGGFIQNGGGGGASGGTGGRKKRDPRFTPSYELDAAENMQFLMSNEYMRIWFKERDVFLKDNRTKAEIVKGETKIKRNHVQRLMPIGRTASNLNVSKKRTDPRYKPNCCLNSNSPNGTCQQNTKKLIEKHVNPHI